MLYDLSLQIGTDYTHPVASGRHVLRIAPLWLEKRQRVERLEIQIDPRPDSQRDFTTFFGGEATGLAIRHPHICLKADLRARVEVLAPSWEPGKAIALDALPPALAAAASVAPGSPHHFLPPSPRLPAPSADMARYARETLSGAPDVFAAASALMERIHGDFIYDSAATTVDTGPDQALRLRRGVCQDFTHVMIAGLRSLGIPAGYVSGYLRTLPPAGRPRLVGADAMHAWVTAWCGPQGGWIEFDPTNRMLAGEDHIVVGYGRDYSDIAPLSGTVKAHGDQTAFQRVDITVID